MPFQIIRQDITKMNVDAIVNAANNKLLAGGGVCGAIFKAAGMEKLQAACNKIGYCETGMAVITNGFDLPAKYVIHTVGPIYREGNTKQAKQLYDCYYNSLTLARKKRLNSVAFALISSGIYGYPKSEALEIARTAISDFLDKYEMSVYLVVYDKASFEISRSLFDSIQSYIDETMVKPPERSRSISEDDARKPNSYPYAETAKTAMFESDVPLRLPKQQAVCDAKVKPRKLEDLFERMDETFSQMLLRLIDERGLKDSAVYKKANIDRKLFSKIRTDKSYQPKKATALSFAVALELSLDETKDLLGRAGYALSHSNKADIILEYFIEQQNYNIFEINEALFAFDQPLLSV